MGGRVTIEIDEVVFRALQAKATPLVDTPNDVLRRLLLGGKSALTKEGHAVQLPHSTEVSKDSDVFARQIIEQEFGPGFARRSPYRFMFESPDRRVYVQNFNQRAHHVWYRITERPWRDVQRKDKRSWLCFTNPADNYAFVIPVEDVQRRIGEAGWKRDYLEVNINAVESRWVELTWNIGPYLKTVPA